MNKQQQKDTWMQQRLTAHLCANALRVSIFNLLLALFVVFFIDYTNPNFTVPYAWLSLMITAVVLRFATAAVMLKTERYAAQQYSLHVMSLMMTGILWGSFYFIYFEPLNSFQHMLLILVMVGISSSSTISLSLSFLCYYALVAPMIVFTIITNGMHLSNDNIAVIAILAIYTLFLISTHGSNLHLLKSNVLHEFRQKQLITKLKASNHNLNKLALTDNLTGLANHRHFT